ncbi:MAG: hypothetical protein ACXW1D_06165 [Halobacteriota archaeon]
MSHYVGTCGRQETDPAPVHMNERKIRCIRIRVSRVCPTLFGNNATSSIQKYFEVRFMTESRIEFTQALG